MKRDRLLEIMSAFKNIKIAVIGDMMLDDYIIGNVDRISPEAPVPVINVTEERFVLGGAANVVNNLSTLEAETFAYGVIGNDSNGKRLTNEFKSNNINTDGIMRVDDRATIVKRRIIAHNQHLLRLDWEDKRDISKNEEDKLIENVRKNIENIDVIILSDYDKGVLTGRVAKEIIALANTNGKIITVDPKPKNAKNYISATSMTPNRKEAMKCIGLDKIDDIEKLGKELKSKLNLKNLLLTKSEEGMSLFEDETINIPTFAKEVYDVTGAGDTVISVFTLAAAAGATWHEAAKIANIAAGVVVGRMGTSTVTKEEVIKFYNEIYHEWGGEIEIN